MPPQQTSEGRIDSRLFGLLLVSAVLGTVHAFSVLAEPLEDRLDAGRGQVSFAYSIALASLTAAVTLGDRIYRSASPPALVGGACLGAAAGLLVAAFVDSLAGLWIGYGLIFGFANGVGYGVALHLANQWFDRRRGVAMGSVTAVYAIGAGGAAFVIEPLASDSGAQRPLVVLAALIAVVGVVAVGLIQWKSADATPHLRDARMPVSAVPPSAVPGVLDRRRIALAWLAFGTAVAAGLMAMGHAASIVADKGGSSSDGVRGAVVIVVLNAAAGLTVGLIADRFRAGPILVFLGVTSAAGLATLAFSGHVGGALVALGLVGLGYGATISIFPILTARLFGADLYAVAYGRIFTSWGLAGLLAPWLAGVLFSRTDTYRLPLLVAAALALISTVLASRLVADSSLAR